MVWMAYEFPTYVVVTDQPVEEGYSASWEVPDPIATQIIDGVSEFEVVDEVFLVDGEPL